MLRYRLSEPADVRLRVHRLVHGRWRTVRTIVRRGRHDGRNVLGFTGRLGRHALKPGRYRAALWAVDAAGNRGRARDRGSASSGATTSTQSRRSPQSERACDGATVSILGASFSGG